MDAGEGHGYAAITYGWLVGELIRRADAAVRASQSWRGRPGRWGWTSMSGWVTKSFYRVAHVARSKGNMGDAAAQRLLKAMMNEPSSMSTRAFTNPPSIMTSTNKPEWRRMEQPAAKWAW